jgi:hypothetical protein
MHLKVFLKRKNPKNSLLGKKKPKKPQKTQKTPKKQKNKKTKKQKPKKTHWAGVFFKTRVFSNRGRRRGKAVW